MGRSQGFYTFSIFTLIMISIRDPIYRTIEIEDEFLPLINNPYFQRLRNIKQNSLLYYVYPSAKHDRFSHSMGVYHLMRRVLGNKNNSSIFTTQKPNMFWPSTFFSKQIHMKKKNL